MSLLSVIVPVRDEALVLDRFHARLAPVLDGCDGAAEILFVDDGSTDATPERLAELRRRDARVGVIRLARNFGKEHALAAGLDHARGDAVVVIDADLQDPPEVIAEFVAHWREGFDVVYGVRTARDGESRLKRATSWLFYRALRRASDVPAPVDTGDFRLLSRRAVDAVRALPERARYLRGQSAWIGLAQRGVPFHREARAEGASKFSYRAMTALAGTAFLSHGRAVLHAGVLLGLLLLLAGALAAFTASALTAVVLAVGGANLVLLGAVGIYVAAALEETRGRPLYVVDHLAPPRAGAVDEHRDRAVRMLPADREAEDGDDIHS